jgi:hypothetical protein
LVLIEYTNYKTFSPDNNFDLYIGFFVSKSLQNSAYDSATHLNDIALLILTEPVVLNTHINLACLPYEQSATYPSEHQNSWVAGWVSELTTGSWAF